MLLKYFRKRKFITQLCKQMVNYFCTTREVWVFRSNLRSAELPFRRGAKEKKLKQRRRKKLLRRHSVWNVLKHSEWKCSLNLARANLWHIQHSIFVVLQNRDKRIFALENNCEEKKTVQSSSIQKHLMFPLSPPKTRRQWKPQTQRITGERSSSAERNPKLMLRTG